nr:hypothetical protein [Millionella massiliensis]
MASYNVDTFLVDALRKIEFFTDAELDDPSLAETLSDITHLSVGSNPRSLKRLTNTLALISIINEMQRQADTATQERLNKILNYALVCIQIAYPYIYNQLTEEPDFKSWNEKTASKLKLRPLTETELESLDATEEFNDEWEKVVFRMCQKETYLSTRVFSVSSLFNKIADWIGDDTVLGEVIAATLELSAVTNLKAFDGPMKSPGGRNRDTQTYSFNGKPYPKKTEFVHDVVAYYVAQHPETTHEQLKEAFAIKRNMDKVFMDYDQYLAQLTERGSVDFFGRRPDIPTIQLADKKIVIATNWPTQVNGKPAEFAKLLKLLHDKFNYDVTGS